MTEAAWYGVTQEVVAKYAFSPLFQNRSPAPKLNPILAA
jgi:hypothetical protein